MHVRVNGWQYYRIRSLRFSPSADLIGASLPINEFEVEIYTEDEISIGGYAELRDDLDELWARYWIIYAEREEPGWIRIRAQSDLAVLDRVTLPAVYYEGKLLAQVLDDTIVRGTGSEGVVIPLGYRMDNSFERETVTGFCPEQTARERLLWLCFTVGAYVKTFGNSYIQILPIDEEEALIPIGDTYMRPTVNYSDWVTAVKVTSYSFAAGEPSTTDKWVKDASGTTYIVTEQTASLSSPNVPAGAPENVVSIEGVYLVNSQNVSALLTRLALWYSKRTSLDLEAIDNGVYMPGDRVTACANAEALYTGYIESCDFTFGLQAKARMKLTAVEETDAAGLTVRYLWQGMQVAIDRYLLPVGYEYALDTRYIDHVMSPHRYILRPTVAQVTGTLAAEGAAEDVGCETALIHDEEMVLEVISVDSLSEEEGVVSIS